MSGENCLISIPNYGKTRVWCEAIVHGLNIFSFSGNSDESRTRRQFFTAHRTSGSFSLDLIFKSHRSRERFLNWLEEYARWAANPATPSTPVRVVIPSRRFDKIGVLEGSLSYGDEVGMVLYKAKLDFMGGRDPLDIEHDVGLQNIIGYQDDSTNKDGTLVRLYPQGSAQNSNYRWGDTGTVTETDFDGPRSGRI